jgi:hypothetical protein
VCVQVESMVGANRYGLVHARHGATALAIVAVIAIVVGAAAWWATEHRRRAGGGVW